MDERAPKRRRLSPLADSGAGEQGRTLASLTRAISPPPKKKTAPTSTTTASTTPRRRRRTIPSPFQLTKIRDLSAACNADAVALGDLLGDPLIAECWEFNYLHDVDFLLRHLDQDTRALTQVHVVHGFWKREDPNRVVLEQQAAQYANVTLHTAFMPEMFGTHHSKMLILFRHDDSAQVIIHTANMIAKDWTNLTNGVWRSPLLPLLKSTTTTTRNTAGIGSGARFKTDLLNYLRAYNTRRDVCRALVDRLAKHDFAAVRAALVASVPGRHDVNDEPQATRWGWAGLRHALRSVPVAGEGEIAVQISSVATLGPTDSWLRRTLFEALSACKTTRTSNNNSSSSSNRDKDNVGKNDSSSSSSGTANPDKPDFKIIFPTPDEIRASLDGYASGASIHMKTQSPQQRKQLEYMRPMLCHWANDTVKGVSQPGPAGDAGRKRAAPHIKTYIRYSPNTTPTPNSTPSSKPDSEVRSIDWALLTSANLSKQAWGEAASGSGGGQIRIASWEIGVLVWPELLGSTASTTTGMQTEMEKGKGEARMVPTFRTDMPPDLKGEGEGEKEGEGEGDGVGDKKSKGEWQGEEESEEDAALIGLRIPYSLPLRRYAGDEVPWVATARYTEPDWMGRSW